MQNNWLIVLSSIVALLLVILLGLYARRKNILTDETANRISHFLVDYCMPAMVFTNMIATVTPKNIKTDWYLPVLGAVIILFGFFIGFIFSLIFRVKEKSTYTFLTGVANWVYLPLPIAYALYGADGMRIILLFNVGAQFILWSVGVAILKREKPSLKTLTELLKNNGLIATFIGITVALLFPSIGVSIADTNISDVIAGYTKDSYSVFSIIQKTIYDAICMLGGLTIPLTLVITGGQIGGVEISLKRHLKSIIEISSTKLLIIPVISVAIFYFITNILNVHIDRTVLILAILILSMPTAVSCSLFTERFSGNTITAALSILYTTLLSCLSVPFIYYLAERVPFK